MTKITIANLYDDLQTSLQSLRDDPAAVRRSREIVERALRDGRAYYGINTGFGALARERVPDDQLRQLQRNLLLSHSVGVGPPAPREISALMLELKVHSLGLGYSGISLPVFQRLLLFHGRRPRAGGAQPRERGGLGRPGAAGPLVPAAAGPGRVLGRERVGPAARRRVPGRRRPRADRVGGQGRPGAH